MTPEQFDALRSAENSADAEVWRWLVAGAGIAVVLVALAVWAYDHFKQRSELERWHREQAALALAIEWPDECDRSWLCPADRHVPGCYAEAVR